MTSYAIFWKGSTTDRMDWRGHVDVKPDPGVIEA
jgi:hypothetical protein